MDPSNKPHRIRGEINDHYDVIIVGAGIGGLVASAILARAGKRVLTLDQHYVPGGCVSEFRRKGWRFDVGLHYVGDCAPGGNVDTMLKACGVNDIVFRPFDEDLEHISLPGLEIGFPSDRETLRRRLIERFPAERRGIERYVRLLNEVNGVSRAEESLSKLEVAWSLSRAWLLIRYAFGPISVFIDSCTSDPQLRAFLMIHAGTHGVSPARVSTALHAGTQNHYLKSGAYYPEGGGQRVSNRIAEELEAAGGELRLNTKVRRIIIDGGRATGVVIENKYLGRRTVKAPVIVSNADYKRTVIDLVGSHHFPRQVASRVRDLEMALPFFVVYLGLDIPPAELPYGNRNTWIGDRLDIEADYRKLLRGELTLPPTVFMTTKSLKDPGDEAAAPPGHTNLELMTIVPRDPKYWGITAAQIADGSYRQNEAYERRKAEIAEACLDQATRIIPDLREHIVFRETASPMTQSRYTWTSDGASCGLAATPAQFLGKRPGAESGIPGLFFCGTNCRQGHGVISSMGSAVDAADKILKTSETEVSKSRALLPWRWRPKALPDVG